MYNNNTMYEYLEKYKINKETQYPNGSTKLTKEFIYYLIENNLDAPYIVHNNKLYESPPKGYENIIVNHLNNKENMSNIKKEINKCVNKYLTQDVSNIILKCINEYDFTNESMSKIKKEINKYLIQDVTNITLKYIHEYYIADENTRLTFSPADGSRFPKICDYIYDLEFEGELFMSIDNGEKHKVDKNMVMHLMQFVYSDLNFYGGDFKYKCLFLEFPLSCNLCKIPILLSAQIC